MRMYEAETCPLGSFVMLQECIDLTRASGRAGKSPTPDEKKPAQDRSLQSAQVPIQVRILPIKVKVWRGSREACGGIKGFRVPVAIWLLQKVL
jgi:hypothetical protein